MNKVITLEYPEPTIALMTMADRNSKNTFSEEFKEGVKWAFQEINENHELKVVIATGYDKFFCCGGTFEELLELTDGKKTFLDSDFFTLPLKCGLPTIAAIQGHAIGGGLAFTCLFDYLILSNESYYHANFMKMGFTPGMGATYTIPKKFGTELGQEMLFTAKKYSGKDLKERNPSLSVYPRKQVLEKALELAHHFSDKTHQSIKLLKNCYSETLKATLDEVLKKEVAMHTLTLCTDEAKKRIKALKEDV